MYRSSVQAQAPFSAPSSLNIEKNVRSDGKHVLRFLIMILPPLPSTIFLSSAPVVCNEEGKERRYNSMGLLQPMGKPFEVLARRPVSKYSHPMFKCVS